MKVSIIIPVYNAQDTLELCLSAACRSELNDFEVLVIDDASTDASAEIAGKYPCRLISLKENRGSAAARNMGVRHAIGGIIVFIDSDVIVYPEAVASLVRHLEDARISGAIGVYSPENRYKNFLSQYKHMVVCFRDMMTEDVNQDSFKTSFAALKKEVFRDTPFDENYKKATIEDIEFGRALIDKGFRFVLDKDIRVEHVKHFGLIGYFKSQCRRAYDIGINYATRRSHEFYYSKKRRNFYAKAYVLRVPLSILLVLCAAIFLFSRNTAFLYLSAAIFITSVFLEHEFLRFCLKKRGVLFAVRSGLFYFIDGLICSLGVFRAVLHCTMFKKRQPDA